MGLRRSFKATNLISNGDFRHGTTGWGVNNGGTLATSDNILSHTANNSAAYPDIIQNTSTPAVTGHKIYIVAKLLVTNAVTVSMYIALGGSTGGATLNLTTIGSPTIDTWYAPSGILTLTNQTGNIRFYAIHHYADAATANGKVLEIRQVMAINLTTLFGAGNEPTAAWCNLNIPTWFDGSLAGSSMSQLFH